MSLWTSWFSTLPWLKSNRSENLSFGSKSNHIRHNHLEPLTPGHMSSLAIFISIFILNWIKSLLKNPRWLTIVLTTILLITHDTSAVTLTQATRTVYMSIFLMKHIPNVHQVARKTLCEPNKMWNISRVDVPRIEAAICWLIGRCTDHQSSQWSGLMKRTFLN